MKAFYKTWCRLTGVLFLLSCIIGFDAKAQNSVVIGGNSPDPNAVLLLIGNGSQGLVIPITSDPTAMQKVQGMIVFNKSDNKVYYCDGSAWKVATGGGSSATQTLSISGNTLAISDGNNVTIASSAPTQPGQILMWDGAKWTSSSTTAPTATGQVLKWNNTTKSWEAGTDAGGTSYTAGTGISITGSTIANTGVTSISTTAPLSVLSATTTPAISITQANATSDGYLSKADWTTFNGKLDGTSTPAVGEISGSYNAGFQIVAGSIQNIDVSNTAAIAGTKISPDFGTQNITTTGKTILNTVSYGWPATQGAANTFLKNDGAGNLSWATPPGSSFSTDKTIPRGNGTTLVASQLYDDGTKVGLGTVTPVKKFDVSGDINISSGSGFYINGLRFLGENTGIPANTFIGEEAGVNVDPSNGIHNTFVGYQSGKLDTKGTYNTFVAAGAGGSNVDGNYNVYIGADAGLNSVSGSLNTYVGFNAGKASTTAISSTFFGNKAGEVNTTASFNTFIGERSGQANTTGEENTFVGRTSGLTNTVGTKNTIIGSTANVASNNLSNATAIGYGAIVSASNSLVLGNGASVGIGISNPAYPLDVVGNVHGTSFVNGSDIRWKKDIITLHSSLNKVLSMRGIEYSWRKDSPFGKTDSTRQIGFVAQEVESVIPELITTDPNGYKSVKYANITAVLVEAMKEQQSQIDALKKTIEALEAKLKTYESKENDELAIIRAELRKLNELVGVEARAEKK